MTPRERAEWLIEQGYWQISRHYGLFVRMEGDPQKVLFDARMQEYRGLKNELFWYKEMEAWVKALGPDQCRRYYLRVHSTDRWKAPDVEFARMLTREFHKLGGKTA